MDWDPDFPDRSPMLEPLREPADALRAHRDWPRREALQGLLDAREVANADGRQLRLVDEKREKRGQTRYIGSARSRPPKIESDPYEERIRLHAEMPFREGGWHDLFNVLAWLAYPAAKAAVNDMHCIAMPEEGTQRGRKRDALTLLDESGAIVLSSDESLLDDVRALRWKRLFVERREEVGASMRFHVLGHALFEKALQPYVGMTAHALLFTVSAEVITGPLARRLETADGLAAAAVRRLATPRALSPLPLLGVPGWWMDNEDAAFYDNAAYFRSRRGNPSC